MSYYGSAYHGTGYHLSLYYRPDASDPVTPVFGGGGWPMGLFFAEGVRYVR